MKFQRLLYTSCLCDSVAQGTHTKSVLTNWVFHFFTLINKEQTQYKTVLWSPNELFNAEKRHSLITGQRSEGNCNVLGKHVNIYNPCMVNSNWLQAAIKRRLDYLLWKYKLHGATSTPSTHTTRFSAAKPRSTVCLSSKFYSGEPDENGVNLQICKNLVGMHAKDTCVLKTHQTQSFRTFCETKWPAHIAICFQKPAAIGSCWRCA